MESFVQYRWVQSSHINSTAHLSAGQLISWIEEDALMLASFLSKNLFEVIGFEKVIISKAAAASERLKFTQRVVNIDDTSFWTFCSVTSEDEQWEVAKTYCHIVCVDASGRPKQLEVNLTVPHDEYWRFVEFFKDE